MNSDLQDGLYRAWPEVFLQKDLDPANTACAGESSATMAGPG